MTQLNRQRARLVFHNSKMVNIQLILGLLMLILTPGRCQEQNGAEAQTAGCLQLVQAGMAAYDMQLTLDGGEGLRKVNQQHSISVDLTDRSAVQDFLCELSGVTSFSELAELLGLTEPSLRLMYNQIMSEMSHSYGVDESEDGVRELLTMFSILNDVADFADEVGFNPGHSTGRRDNSNTEEEEKSEISETQASGFIEYMTQKYGADFAGDLLNFFGFRGDVKVDADVLLAAIVDSETANDFARVIGVPVNDVTPVWTMIGIIQGELYPHAGYTMSDYLDIGIDLGNVLLNLGFFSWE